MSGAAQAYSPQGLYFTEFGSGPPLLLVHGTMINGDMFEPIVGPLASTHRVIIPDLRGHGRSRGMPPPYTCEQLAADLVALLDHLGLNSVAVLGYSQGGAIAQQLAINYPKRCSRLVLVCTYAFNMVTVRERMEGYLVPILLTIMGMRLFARVIISQGLQQVPKARAEWVSALIANQDRQRMIEAWRAAMVFDSRGRLGEISCPTLVIAGSCDNAVPLHHAQMLHTGIHGSKLIVVEGVDHAFIWEKPDELLRTLTPFFDAASLKPTQPTRDV